MGMQWSYDGHALGMRWAYDGHAMGIRWACDGHAMGMRWACDQSAIAHVLIMRTETEVQNCSRGRVGEARAVAPPRDLAYCNPKALVGGDARGGRTGADAHVHLKDAHGAVVADLIVEVADARELVAGRRQERLHRRHVRRRRVGEGAARCGMWRVSSTERCRWTAAARVASGGVVCFQSTSDP